MYDDDRQKQDENGGDFYKGEDLNQDGYEPHELKDKYEPPHGYYSYVFDDPSLFASEPKKKRSGTRVFFKVVAIILAAALSLSVIALAVYGGLELLSLGSKSPIVAPPPIDRQSENLPSVEIHEVIDGGKIKKTVIDGTPLDTADIAEIVRPAVVGIECNIISASGLSGVKSGSGIIMSSDGYIITNQHVINEGIDIVVILDSGEKYGAVIVGQDENSDIAVLKIAASALTYARFGDSDQLRVGDRAIAIGNPVSRQLAGSVTQGIISAINRDLVIGSRSMTLIQTDASINSGNSGGPLVSEYGLVVGINSAKISGSAEGLGFAIPINQAKPIIDDLIKNGYVTGRPILGITGYDVYDRQIRYYGWPEGVYVESTTTNEAKESGLKKGDIITAINGAPISTMDGLNAEKAKYKAGDTIEITIYREQEYYVLSLRLSEEGR